MTSVAKMRCRSDTTARRNSEKRLPSRGRLKQDSSPDFAHFLPHPRARRPALIGRGEGGDVADGADHAEVGQRVRIGQRAGASLLRTAILRPDLAEAGIETLLRRQAVDRLA